MSRNSTFRNIRHLLKRFIHHHSNENNLRHIITKLNLYLTFMSIFSFIFHFWIIGNFLLLKLCIWVIVTYILIISMLILLNVVKPPLDVSIIWFKFIGISAFTQYGILLLLCTILFQGTWISGYGKNSGLLLYSPTKVIIYYALFLHILQFFTVIYFLRKAEDSDDSNDRRHNYEIFPASNEDLDDEPPSSVSVLRVPKHRFTVDELVASGRLPLQVLTRVYRRAMRDREASHSPNDLESNNSEDSNSMEDNFGLIINQDQEKPHIRRRGEPKDV